MHNNVVSIPPKSTTHKYKGVPIRISFMPAHNAWQWEITVTRTFKLEDTAKTEDKALKAAKKAIDSTAQR